MPARRLALSGPSVGCLDHGVGRTQGVGRRRGRGRHRAERRQDSVAQELVDAAAVAHDQRADAALVILQELHDIVRCELGGKPGEAAQVDRQDRHVAQFALARLDRHRRAADAGGDAWVEEAREVARGRAFADRAHQQVAGARDGDRQHDGGQQDGDDLVGLGLNQKRIGRHVLDEIVGHVRRPAAAAQRVEDQRDPARHRSQPGDDHEARLESQRAQGNQQEYVKQDRRLQVEDGRLGIFVVEGVDQSHQQGGVGDRRHMEEPLRQPAAVGQHQSYRREHAIDDEHLGFERVVLLDHAGGHSRGLVGDGEQADQHQLGPADQDLAAILLAADGFSDALRQVLRRALEQPVAQAGEHQRFSSHRLAAMASGGCGRRWTTEAASRPPSRRSAQALENSGR